VTPKIIRRISDAARSRYFRVGHCSLQASLNANAEADMIVATLTSSGSLAEFGHFDVLVISTERLPELGALRAAIADKVRLIGRLDSHAELTPDIVAASDALVVAEQLDAVLNEANPVTAVVPLPLSFDESARETTAFREVLDLADEQRGMPLILANAILLGETGVKVVVVADGDDTYARNSADDLASAMWERRDRIEAEMKARHRPSRPWAAPDAFAAWEPGREDGVWFGIRRGLNRA